MRIALSALVALPLMSATTSLLAAEGAGATAPSAPSATPDFAAGLGQMLFGLAIVIALLLACLWTIKRLSVPRGSAAAMKVLGAVPVGPRERVVLVSLGDKVLVLGVAPGTVNTLHVLAAEELPTPSADAQPRIGAKDFSGWLKQAMDRKHAP